MQNSLNDFRSALFAADFQLAENIGLDQIQQLGEKADWLNELGILFLMKGDLPEALRFFDRAIQADPNFIEAQFNATIILSDLGFYDEAAIRFQDACQREGVILARKHYDMCLFYQSVGKFQEAIEEILKAIHLIKNHDYYIELTRIYIELQKFNEALQSINEAIILNPQSTIAQNLKHQCEQTLDQYLANRNSGKEFESKIMQ